MLCFFAVVVVAAAAAAAVVVVVVVVVVVLMHWSMLAVQMYTSQQTGQRHPCLIYNNRPSAGYTDREPDIQTDM